MIHINIPFAIKKISLPIHNFKIKISHVLNACRNNMKSPIISSPLSMRTEERAASRKKAKLYSLFLPNDSIDHCINSVYSSSYLSLFSNDLH